MRYAHPPASRAAALLGAAALLLSASAAVAQDYDVSWTEDLYTAPPASATVLSLGNDSSTSVELPFDFPYFGSVYDSVWVHANGFTQFGVETPSAGTDVNDSFPWKGSETGLRAPFWTDSV